MTSRLKVVAGFLQLILFVLIVGPVFVFPLLLRLLLLLPVLQLLLVTLLMLPGRAIALFLSFLLMLLHGVAVLILLLGDLRS